MERTITSGRFIIAKLETFRNFKRLYHLFQAPDHEMEAALDEALKAGYRHIDAAPVYMNEKAIGRVLKKWLDSSNINREDLFVTTKLPPPGRLYAITSHSLLIFFQRHIYIEYNPK